jgi:hypothetical protein
MMRKIYSIKETKTEINESLKKENNKTKNMKLVFTNTNPFIEKMKKIRKKTIIEKNNTIKINNNNYNFKEIKKKL